MTTITDAAHRIAAQLDQRGNPDLIGLPETLCRALKVQEEAGEMAQAVIGVLGQNPRKGITHTWDDVVAEAIDTALSALVLAETVRPGMLGLILAGRLDHLARRAAASGAPDTYPAVDPDPADDDAPGQRQAATLRWLLDAHTEHGLPLPEDFIGYASGSTLRLRLSDDQADGVRRWAAYLGLSIEQRDVEHNGNRWVHVGAESSYNSDVTGLGWRHVEVVTSCDRKPVAEAAPLAVVA
ncbi:MazG-like family protein [Actinoplanes sp. NPDC026619]|uniref:MazG-like family protein n=1 Tax=Actinoplanes sp. NPDC026619 TaxID=3155798 RepID=UPI0033C1A4AB